MANGTAYQDVEWLKRLLRKHFRQSWRRVATKLKARQAEVMSRDATARMHQR